MDMWNPYRQIGKKVFPKRLIVADKFHVVRMANEGMERVRKRIRKAVDDKTRLKLKDERFVLLKRKNKLTDEDREKARRWFALFPELGAAYEAKERFFNIYDHDSRAAAEHAADQWVASLDPAIAHDFRNLRVALHNWHNEIFNYYEQPVTNAYTESVNNLARFINRMGRGYSFEVIRARLLFDEAAVKGARSTVRKKPRREKTKPEFDGFTFGRIAITNDYEETEANYGAHLPTLVSLLEEGYFA